MFSTQISLASLPDLCRLLRHNLAAGLAIVEVFRQQSQRGRPEVRAIAGRVADRLQQGESLHKALSAENDRFPPLFLNMVRVGEETGHLPEIFGELENYYALERKLRRQFISQSILPVLQFFFAIFIVAGLIWVLGMIGDANSTKPISLFGLSGPRGALTFLGAVFGPLSLLGLVYLFVKRELRHTAKFEALLLRVPALGTCLEAIAMSRLCLCMQLTLDSGMPIGNAMRLNLNATGNSAFAAHADQVAQALKKRIPLTEALAQVRPLPPGFVDLVASAEQAGTVPEMMRHQAEYYQEEAGRRLTALTRVASAGLWLMYAGCVIYAIFAIAQVYLGALKQT